RPEHVYLLPEVTVTDCLEFDRELRVIDPADELGYLALECERLGETSVHGWLFAAYSEATGDYPPDDLISFYKACRGLQRAKLAIWHLDEPDCADRGRWHGRARDYLELAGSHA